MRKALIKNELYIATNNLSQLNKEYNSGQPARLGNEKNYQTYLDRVEKLRKQIQMSETNIKSLENELAR